MFLQVGFFMMIVMGVAFGMGRTRGGRTTAVQQAGVQFDVRVARARNKQVTGAWVALEMPDKLRFRLRRERWFDRIAKNFGIVREWQTGDAAFDQRVFILSEDASFNEALSARRQLRDACVKLLFERDRSALECKAGRLYFDCAASGSRDTGDETVAGELVREVGASLTLLRDGLRAIVAEQWDASRDPSLTRKAWLVGICLALGILGCVTLFTGGIDRHHQVVHVTITRYAVWITTGVVGSLLAAVWLWLRATPHTHAVLFDILLAALPGTFLAARAGAVIYNEYFDHGAPRLAPVNVVQTYMHSGKSRSYYLEVAAWPDARGDRSIQIDSGDFAWIHGGDCVTAEWRPGALGDGWVAGYTRGCAADQSVER